jgi:probable HAF family extracellular repeat protein
MKRITILALIICTCFVTVAWAQQQAAPAMKQHPASRHRVTNEAANYSRTSNPYNIAPANSAQNKVWELGTYPGGTWASMGDVNDFGVAVAQGDLPDGSTHNFAVLLFGRHAGEWIDLGTLGGTESGWDEGLVTISDTGLIVGHSASTDQDRPHAIAWTEKSDMVDLGTLADIGYLTYNSSYASGVNKLGTLIVGWSGVEESCLGCAPTLPVVWTPTVVWKNGQLVTKWKIHKLDTTGFAVITKWYPWAVNDFGQIVGEGSGDNGEYVGVLWTPLQNGKWKVTQLPALSEYPEPEPFNINDRGEISGDIEPADFSVWIPAFWKPLDSSRKTYSNPIVLPMPDGGFANCYTDGINELGDLTGECWAQDHSVDQAVRWTTKDTTFSQVLGFPGDWSWSFRVNNDRIAVVTYGGGDKCSADDYISCGGAIQLH